MEFKKSLADAAVDGVVPEGHLRSPAQAYKDAMEWLQRLDTEGVFQTARPPIATAMLDVGDDGHQSRAGQY